MVNVKNILKHFGNGSLTIIVITFILFAIALFVKGFTHDLLLELAIFLVSVKLILMTYKNSIASEKLEKKLDNMDEKIEQIVKTIK